MAIMAPSALVSMQFHWNKLGGSSLWFIAHVCKHIGVQSHTYALERTTVGAFQTVVGAAALEEPVVQAWGLQEDLPWKRQVSGPPGLREGGV